MEEKEMNKQILFRLYNVADFILNSLQLEPGAYTANEILMLAKKGKISFWQLDEDLNPINIAVEGFTCSLPYSQVFHFIAKFEKLAGVTGDKRHLFVIESENNHYISKVTVRINSAYVSLCKCADMQSMYDDFHHICVEVGREEVCATNGQNVQIKSLQVVDSSEYDLSGTRPMIDADIWAKMCKKAEKSGADLVCTLKEVKDKHGYKNTVWESVCCGYVSTIEERKGLDYYKVLPKVDINHKVEMSLSEWKKAKKWIKATIASFGDENARLIIDHSENGRFLTFTAKDSDFSLSAVAKFECAASPAERWTICFNGSTLANDLDQFCLYLPYMSESAAIFVNSDNIQLRMPMLLPVDIDGYAWSNDTYTVNVSDIVDLRNVAIIEPAKNHRVRTAKKPAVLKTEEQEDKKTCKVVEIPAKSAKVEIKKTSKMDRAFSFDKIGLSVGTTIQFIDGTDVTIAENNMIEFCGELFTLSGFTRTFIPDNKANKSGAYRGCAFFYYQGVRLDKMLKEALSSQEIPSTEKVEEIKADIAQVHEVQAVEVAAQEVDGNKAKEQSEAVIIQLQPFTAQVAENIKVASAPTIREAVFVGLYNVSFFPDIRLCGGGVPIISRNVVLSIDTVTLGCAEVIHELPLPPPWGKAA